MKLSKQLEKLGTETAFAVSAAAGEWAGLAACNQTLANTNDVLALHDACSRLFEQLQALGGPQSAERWNEQLGSAIHQLSGGHVR